MLFFLLKKIILTGFFFSCIDLSQQILFCGPKKPDQLRLINTHALGTGQLTKMPDVGQLEQGEMSRGGRKVRAPPTCTCSVTSISLGPFGLWPPRLLCPLDFPGKNTGVGCHFLLQGIVLTQCWTWVSWISCTEGRFFTQWAIRLSMPLLQRHSIQLFPNIIFIKTNLVVPAHWISLLGLPVCDFWHSHLMELFENFFPELL